ncbi:MAG: HypC/HybG/HupF family hydrogenase formation chaperone [Synechococcaceae cyanobacterium ELA263]
MSAPPPPASSPAAAPAPDSPLPDSPLSAPALDPLWRVAEVDFGGVRQQVSLACLPEARVGDRVLVHVGFALSLVEEEDEWQ